MPACAGTDGDGNPDPNSAEPAQPVPPGQVSVPVPSQTPPQEGQPTPFEFSMVPEPLPAGEGTVLLGPSPTSQGAGNTTPGPSAGISGNPFVAYAPDSLNSLRRGLTHRGGADTTTVMAALSRAATNAISLPPLASNGPFTAQCLMSYPAGYAHPPGTIYDMPQGPAGEYLTSLPWIVAHIPGIHPDVPDPAFYNPNGTGRQRFLFWQSIIKHMNAGRVFFPEVESVNYGIPMPGDKVTVYYSDVSSYSGGKYVYVNDNSYGKPSPLRTAASPQNPLNPNIIVNPDGTISPTNIPEMPENRLGLKELTGLQTTNDGTSDGHGQTSTTLRSDVADRFAQLRDILNSRGSYLTSAGSNISLRAADRKFRSRGRRGFSFHTIGLAMDLASYGSSMGQNRNRWSDRSKVPYIIQRDFSGTTYSNGARKYYWTVWAQVDPQFATATRVTGIYDKYGRGVRGEDGPEPWRTGEIHEFEGHFINLSEIARGLGINHIPNNSPYPRRQERVPRGSSPPYMQSEWWHLQCNDLAAAGTYGELLLQIHDPEDVARSAAYGNAAAQARRSNGRAYFSAA